jgi:hypothetical protein
MTYSNGDVKSYSEELVRVTSYPPFLTLTVKTRPRIYRNRHELARPKSKAAWVNFIACCGETRTRTGDTMIFRHVPYFAMERHG